MSDSREKNSDYWRKKREQKKKKRPRPEWYQRAKSQFQLSKEMQKYRITSLNCCSARDFVPIFDPRTTLEKREVSWRRKGKQNISVKFEFYPIIVILFPFHTPLELIYSMKFFLHFWLRSFSLDLFCYDLFFFFFSLSLSLFVLCFETLPYAFWCLIILL